MSPRSDRPRRRSFTNEDKSKILVEYDALDEPGAKGALLRREGLYSSHLVEWRRARDTAAAAGQSTGQRVPDAPVSRSRSTGSRLGLSAERELAKTRAALDVV